MPDPLRLRIPAAETLAPDVREAIEHELLRVNMRFIEEFIERYNICPFSRCGRCVGAVGRRLYTDEITEDRPELSEAFLKSLDRVAQSPKIEVMLCIFPWARIDARAWRRFTEHVRLAVNARHNKPIYAAAAFHPELPFGEDTPDRAVAFFRRSPDPVVQLVRLDVLQRAGAGMQETQVATPAFIEQLLSGNAPVQKRTITEVVTDDNFEMLHTTGLSRLRDELADMTEDRNRSVEALLAGEPLPKRPPHVDPFCQWPLSDETRAKIEAKGIPCRREAEES